MFYFITSSFFSSTSSCSVPLQVLTRVGHEPCASVTLSIPLHDGGPTQIQSVESQHIETISFVNSHTTPLPMAEKAMISDRIHTPYLPNWKETSDYDIAFTLTEKRNGVTCP